MPAERIYFKQALYLEPEDVIIASWYQDGTGSTFAPAKRLRSLREDVVKMRIFRIDGTTMEVILHPQDDRSLKDLKLETEFKLYLPTTAEFLSSQTWIERCEV